MMIEQETCRRVWPEWELPFVSYGLAYPAACAKHVKDLKASRVYIVVSSSLARNSDNLQRLESALGEGKIAGVRVGMKPHTLYSEVIEIANELRQKEVDCLITLGGGSLINSEKGALLVSLCLFYLL